MPPLVATYSNDVWVEHFEWFEEVGIFIERVEMNNGFMKVPERPGIGLTLNEERVKSLNVATDIFN